MELILLLFLLALYLINKAIVNYKVDHYPLDKVSMGKMTMDAGKSPSEIRSNLVSGKYDKDGTWKV